MSISAKNLKTHKLSAEAGVCSAGTFALIRADSPAVDAMTDFARVSAATIGADASLAHTNGTMIARGVRLLLVTSANGHVAGLVSARDLMGEKPVLKAKAHGVNVTELTVADVMCPVSDIDVVTLTDIMNSRVFDVVETMQRLGRQHLLVEDHDPETGSSRVRGVISATQIGRQLGIPVQGFDLARTFAEIESSFKG